ncbi:pentapeptide repeat-containing protein [Nonomuraea sp. MG754425]|uniref:pentapeptide repeat-containing protein n=1 Tax=Nonomuraea sp. MG754425 TaxID=2570319 RepID=UPI001F334E92|nr:hypothetical protein [Nonomuraea sp. MG754425]MCF6467753.1 pentapeptide repeat-containing protein [Nonomuraea sp. MG754425]
MSGQPYDDDTGQYDDTGQQLYTDYGVMPTAAQMGPPSSGISFKPEHLKTVGDQLDNHTKHFDSLQGRSNDMGVPLPGFGVIGLGLAKAHDQAIERQSFALVQGKKALESWKEALKAADENYREAEEESRRRIRKSNNGPFDVERGEEGPGAPGIDLPDSPGMPDADLPDADLPDADLPGTDLPGGDVPGTDLPGADLPDGDPSGTGLPGGDLPGTDTPGTDLGNPNLSAVDEPNMKVPDIGATLNPEQDKTGLSSFDPNQQLAGPPNADSRAGTTWGSPGSGGVGSTGANGPRMPGMTTPGAMTGGMPMMPMTPMAGAGNGTDERDRETNSLLSEDEGVWDGDEEIAPEIIGKEA